MVHNVRPAIWRQTLAPHASMDLASLMEHAHVVQAWRLIFHHSAANHARLIALPAAALRLVLSAVGKQI